MSPWHISINYEIALSTSQKISTNFAQAAIVTGSLITSYIGDDKPCINHQSEKNNVNSSFHAYIATGQLMIHI